MLAVSLRTVRSATFAAVAAGALVGVSQAEARGAPDGFADLAERLSPAVVNIATSQKVERPNFGPGMPFPPGGPLEDFFKDFFGERGAPGGGGKGSAPQTVQSLGSGFVIDPAGYIVTNNHVIEDADEITINFADGASMQAEIVGRDPKTDIALLKLTAAPEAPLASVPLGDSDKVRVGDWVVAIGNPFGLGGTVTAGIVSARNRKISSGPYDDYIQTDAAINRGNSGGPLFDLEGEVIGVNTAIYSPTGGSVGVGFSVPSNIVANVVKQLREFGETRRGWLGVKIRSVTDDLAEGLGLTVAKGALVEGVSDDSPAAKGGLEVGDVILSFNGKDIKEMSELPRAVAETPVGDTVRVVVWRDGRSETVKVEIGLLEEKTGAKEADKGGDSAEAAPEGEVALGMRLEALTAAAREKAGVAEDVKGVLISDVESTGPAAQKGVRAGDVLVEVAQEAVTDVADAVAKIDAAKEAGRKTVLLLVNRGGELRFVAVRFPVKE